MARVHPLQFNVQKVYNKTGKKLKVNPDRDTETPIAMLIYQINVCKSARHLDTRAQGT